MSRLLEDDEDDGKRLDGRGSSRRDATRAGLGRRAPSRASCSSSGHLRDYESAGGEDCFLVRNDPSFSSRLVRRHRRRRLWIRCEWIRRLAATVFVFKGLASVQSALATPATGVHYANKPACWPASQPTSERIVRLLARKSLCLVTFTRPPAQVAARPTEQPTIELLVSSRPLWLLPNQISQRAGVVDTSELSGGPLEPGPGRADRPPEASPALARRLQRGTERVIRGEPSDNSFGLCSSRARAGADGDIDHDDEIRGQGR